MHDKLPHGADSVVAQADEKTSTTYRIQFIIIYSIELYYGFLYFIKEYFELYLVERLF